MRFDRGNRLALGCWAAAVAAGLLTGCGAVETGLKPDAARQLQARVLEVTQASSQSDPASALKALDGLDAELASAQAKGDISEERRRSIATIATAVRADLQDAVAAAEKAAAEQAAAGQTATEQAGTQTSPPAVQDPAPAPAPAPDPGKDDDKKDDKGKGND